MNLRGLAEDDLSVVLEDSETGGATDYSLIDEAGNGYPVSGITGDIGFLINTDGVPVQGRTIEATARISSLTAAGGGEPSDKWTAKVPDITGKEWILFVVRCEPDRTLGVYRMKLGLKRKGG